MQQQVRQNERLLNHVPGPRHGLWLRWNCGTLEWARRSEETCMDQHFLVEKAEQIAIITLNRPEKRNPINVEMLQEFESILRDLRDDAGTRVVILTGAGNTFSTGADLTVVKGVTDEAERRRLFARARRYRIRLISRTLGLLENLEQFTIAAVNGYAVGGGWGLALACDFRIAVPGRAHSGFRKSLGVCR